MKKFKLILFHIILFSLITVSNSYGKSLPPGSGVADVPANVLINLKQKTCFHTGPVLRAK